MYEEREALREQLIQKYYKRKSEKNYHAVVNAYMEIVPRYVSKFFYSDNLTHEEMTQTAYVALLETVRDYNPNKGKKFTSYFMWKLYGVLGRDIMRNTSLIKPPVYGAFWKDQVKRATARKLGFYRELDSPIQGTEDLILSEVLADETMKPVDDRLIASQYYNYIIPRVKKYISRSKRNKEVYTMLLENILGLEEHTVNQMCRIRRCSTSNVRFCRRRLLKAIKKYAKELSVKPTAKPHDFTPIEVPRVSLKKRKWKGLKSWDSGIRMLRNGKFTAHFSNDYLGVFKTREQAIQARKDAYAAFTSTNMGHAQSSK